MKNPGAETWGNRWGWGQRLHTKRDCCHQIGGRGGPIEVDIGRRTGGPLAKQRLHEDRDVLLGQVAIAIDVPA
jgi:hypothetical protein